MVCVCVRVCVCVCVCTCVRVCVLCLLYIDYAYTSALTLRHEIVLSTCVIHTDPVSSFSHREDWLMPVTMSNRPSLQNKLRNVLM